MASKYKGIDQREIKCCDPSIKTIEAGISFDEDRGHNTLCFHFLDTIDYKGGGDKTEPILHQVTKTMWLNKENTKELIKALQELKF